MNVQVHICIPCRQVLIAWPVPPHNILRNSASSQDRLNFTDRLEIIAILNCAQLVQILSSGPNILACLIWKAKSEAGLDPTRLKPRIRERMTAASLEDIKRQRELPSAVNSASREKCDAIESFRLVVGVCGAIRLVGMQRRRNQVTPLSPLARTAVFQCAKC